MPLEDTGSPSPGTNTQDTGGLANSPQYDEDKHLLPKWLRAILLGTAGVAGAAINIFDDEGVLKDAADDIGDALMPGTERNDELMALLQKNFDQQFSFMADREAMFRHYSTDLLNTIKDAPKYSIPGILTATLGVVNDYAGKVKDAYVSGAADVKADIESGITEAMKSYSNNMNEAVSNVKSYGAQGMRQFEIALDGVKKTSGDILNTAKSGFGEALKTYTSLASQGLSGFDTNTAKAVQSYAEGATSIKDLASQVTPQMLDAAQKAADVYKQGGAGVVAGYKKSADIQRGIAKEYAGKIGEYTGKAAESQLTGAKGMLDVYGDMARKKELPGQRLIEEKMGSDFANQIRTIRELGAGEAGALQAVGGVSSGLNQQKQNLAIQAAQYRTDRQADYANAIQQAAAMQSNAYQGQAGAAAQQAGILGGAEQTAQGMVGGAQERMMANQAGAYGNLSGQLGQVLGASTGAQQTAAQLQGGAQMQAGQQTAQNYLQAAGMLGGAGMGVTQGMMNAQNLAGGNLANAYGSLGGAYNQYGGAMGDVYTNTAQMLGGAGMQGAQMQGQADINAANLAGQGYQTAANMGMDMSNMYQNAYDTQFGYNQYNPWAQQINYNQGMMNRTDMTNPYLQLMGDQAGMYLGMMNANQQTQNANTQGMLNTFGNMLNTYSNPSQILPTFMGG